MLIVGVLDHLGYTTNNVSETELTRILKMCTVFSDRVYGVASVPRIVALAEVPDDEVGQAFLAVERLVQPNGFA